MEEVEKVLGSMKYGKAGGPTGIVKKHLVGSHHGANNIGYSKLYSKWKRYAK